jgi:hypothetical protein
MPDPEASTSLNNICNSASNQEYLLSKKSGPLQNQAPKNLKRYAQPVLVSYGLVRNLTQSGTKGNTEHNSVQTFKKASERRVKENIVRLGDHPLGFGLYLFDYRPEFREQWGHGRQFGILIDEVEKVVPSAVSMHADGYKRADYAQLGITPQIH